MLVDFFLHIRAAGVPCSVKEYLTLVQAVEQGVVFADLDEFHTLARCTLVKDERHFDRFDVAFGKYFDGVLKLTPDEIDARIPADWLKKLAEKFLTPEEQAQIKALGDYKKLMDTLKQRLAEQQGRHQGGNKWIGTAGTSPFGAFGFNPEGIRIGQNESRNRKAVKVWDERQFRDYDDQVEIGTRNIKLALRKLRKFAREGAPDVLDLPGTIRATSHNAGYLDLKIVPELRNTVKVLLLLDVGGSMDDHIKMMDELFSAVKSEFKHLEHFYFHNCVYEKLWKSVRRRHTEHYSTLDLLAKYGRDYKLIVVGDASMSPYEIIEPGGSVEHYNEIAGHVWLKRLFDTYPKAAWLNPTPRDQWQWTQSIAMVQKLSEQRMFPLTLAGLDQAIAQLR
jgi:uncharacterized protein